MKILQILEPGRCSWQEAPMPVPAADEILVRVDAITTCPHWDIHLMDGEAMFPGGTIEYPYTPGQPGHEMTGSVEAIGAQVRDFQPGDRVAAWRDRGPAATGCYARYVAFEAAALLKVPDGLAPLAVASLELAMCVQVSFDQLANLGGIAGKRFAVGGLGPAGLIALQMARIYGAGEVVGIDLISQRRDLARQLGADRAVSPDEIPPGRFEPTSFTAGLDCTGLAPAVQFLMDRTRETVALFGVLRDSVAFGFDHWRRGLTLVGYQGHNRQAAEKALAHIASGALKLEALVSRTLPLSRYALGVELLRRKEAVKIGFLPWADED